MRRIIPALSLALGVGLPAAARADHTDGAMRFQILNPDGSVMSTPDEEKFFSLARCVCPVDIGVKLTLSGTVPDSTRSAEIWIGDNCDNVTTRETTCTLLPDGPVINQFITPKTISVPAGLIITPTGNECSRDEGQNTLWVLFDTNGDSTYENTYKAAITTDSKAPPAPECAKANAGEGAVDITWNAPPTGTDIFGYQVLCARADDGMPLSSSPSDDPGYLTSTALCGMDDGVRAEVAACDTTSGVDAGVGGPDAGAGSPDAGPGGPDAGPAAAPAGGAAASIDDLLALDGMFVCGGASPPGHETRVEGLENGVTYHIVLVAYDQHKNASAVDLGEVTPASVTDFWEQYKADGGKAEGGCFVATAAYGDYDHPFVLVLRDFRDHTLARFAAGRAFIAWYYRHSPRWAAFLRRHPVARATAAVALWPVVVLAGAWEYTGPLGKLGLVTAIALAVWLRRRRRAAVPAAVARSRARSRLLAAGVGAALLLVAAGSAHAQPYWDEEAPPEENIGAPQVKWTFELKLGPYVPAIDSEFDLAAGQVGPYELTFGSGSSLLTQIELDRYFLWPAGQLGVAAGLGYMSNSAKAFKQGADGQPELDGNGNPVRSKGDTTTFKLLPTYFDLVYRFTLIDDRADIPLVPYGKLGLSYYVWSVGAPSGDVAEAPSNPDCDPTAGACATDRGRGASLGWQATVGLSVRAEELDHDAARGLRTEMGIEHAGFFAELTYAKVDGFGSDTRLRVGDTTWAAGINFEF